MNRNYLQANFSEVCAACGNYLEVDSPRDFWVEVSCPNCGTREGSTVCLSELIEQAEANREIFGF